MTTSVPPIRLVISDVDGTLVRQDKTLSDGTIAAVARLTATGTPFSLISARPPSGMLWIAEKLGLTTPVGAFNGGTIVRPDGTIVSAERIDPAVARHALALIDRPEVIIWLFHEGIWHAARVDDHYAPREVKAANQQPIVSSDFASLADAADKIVAVSDDHDLLARMESEIGATLGTRATVARSQVYYLDITAPHANKGDGVATLAKTMGVSLAETAVLGDQRNDLPMFARAGYSVAMGQAPEEVRVAASHVSTSNEDDGVAKAIDDLLIPAAKR